jgi:branched-chain amino acid transport system substrate-binding protein
MVTELRRARRRVRVHTSSMAECASMIDRRLLPILLALALVTPISAAAGRRRAVTPREHVDIRIGALFSLSGDGASLGTASAAALDLAVRDINHELDLLHTPYHVTADIENTHLSAATASEQIQLLHARGAQLIIGPQSSAEAAAVLSYANEHDMVVISQGSTASSLAIPDDALFRLAPNDKLEGAAQAALMHADNIDTIVPLWRADAGNTGLRNSTKRSFEALGGIVADGISYDPATTDFAPQVTALGNAVRAVRSQRPAAHIAIYLASFEEAVDIIHLARLDADLSAIRWYAGDGVTQSRALLADANVAAFAADAQLTAPNVGLDPAAREQWQPVSDEIASRIGFAPDAYALSVYDAAWVAILSAIEVENEASLLRDAFSRNVQRYWGVTGPTALDAAGDRRIASFDFWTIRNINGTFDWVRTTQ